MTLASGHWLQWQSSFINTTPQISKFWTLFFHSCWGWRIWRNSFLHLFQTLSAIWHYLLFECRSGMLNSPLWGCLVIVAYHSFGSFIVSTVSGLELMIDSTPVISVARDSLFNEWLCVFNSPSNMDLAEQIWHSHTPPIRQAPHELMCHKIKSPPFSCRKIFIFQYSFQFMVVTKKIWPFVWQYWMSKISPWQESPQG